MMIRRFRQLLQAPVLKVMVFGLALAMSLQMGVAYADPTYTLSGTLTVNSVPIPNASVVLSGGRTTTDAQGHYVINSLMPGRYSVTVGYEPPNPPVGSDVPYIFSVTSGSTYLTINSDTTKDLAFNIGTQTIHVVDTMGRPVANAGVQMAGGLGIFNGTNFDFSDGSDGETFTASEMSGTANTDANGDALVPVAAGINYQTCVYTTVSVCHPVTPTTGVSTTETIPAVGTISGVLQVNGMTVPNALVQIAGRNSTTDANGNYSVPNVPAGNATVYAYYTPPTTPITTGRPYIVGLYSASNYLYVDGDATKNLNFTVGTQTIHVVNTDGNPVPGVNVSMAGGAGIFSGSTYQVTADDGANFTAGQMYGQATTDANGDAQVPVATGLTYQTCAYTSVSTCHSVTPVVGTPTTLTVPTEVPVAPNGLTAVSPTTVPALHWNAVSSATHYNVYRDGGTTPIATVTQNSYTDSGVSDGTHSYAVTATNSGGESPHSTAVSVVVDTTRPVVTVTPAAGGTLSGTVTFNITVSDANPLDANKNKTTWVYLYDTVGTQKSVGAKVNLSNGSGSFTVDTTKLNNGNVNLDVGIVYDAVGNASGTTDNYFRNYTIAN